MAKKSNIVKDERVIVSRGRYFAIALIDYVIFSAVWSLVPFAEGNALPELGIFVFIALEYAIFSYKTRMCSPGMYLLGIFQLIYIKRLDDSGATREWVGRQVDPLIKRYESWLTLFLGFFFFVSGVQFIVSWALGVPLSIGVLSLPYGLALIATGWAFFKLKPWSVYAGFVLPLIYLLFVVVIGFEQWMESIQTLVTAMAKAKHRGYETDDARMAFVSHFMAVAILAPNVLASFFSLLTYSRLSFAAKAVYENEYPRSFNEIYRKYHLAALGVFALVTFALGILGAPVIHPESVTDTATLFSGEQMKNVAQYHEALFKDHDIDYQILTVKAPGSLDVIAHQEFGRMKVGSRSTSGRGLLLVIDPVQNQVRLEVSAALEGVYTDTFVSYIQHRQMIPFFRTGRIADGILATTELIFTRAQDAEAGQAFNPPMESVSAGGGVSNPAQIGAGEDMTFRKGGNGNTATGMSPEQVVASYLLAMDERNGNPILDIYSTDTQAMMSRWTVTAAQMDNVARTFSACGVDRVQENGGYAVLRYDVNDRQCSPYFMVQEGGAWRLDLTMMQKSIRFNHRNEWHFDVRYDLPSSPYGFAFADWSFDQYGFPH